MATEEENGDTNKNNTDKETKLENGTNGVPAATNDSPEENVINRNEDTIQLTIGSMGKYQIILCLLIMLTKFPVAFFQMSIIFLAPPVQYECADDITPTEDVYRLNGSGTCPCENPVYDTSVFKETIIMAWDLICGRKWLADFTQTIFMLGILVGSVSFGSISDRFGRKWPLIWAVVIQIVAGVSAALAPEYWSFTFLRFIVGAATGGTMVVGYVITMEFVGKEYREIISALYQLPFNLGHLILAGFGYCFRTWSTLELAITIPSVLMLSYFWLLPESPRWLLAVGETDAAIKILEKTAKVNKMPTKDIANDINNYQNSKPKGDTGKKGTLLDLYRTPNIRKNTICMTISWLICGFGYYGVSQYIGKLAGNIFINVAFSALITIPGTLISIPIMRKVGRRTVMIVTFVLSSACLFAIAITPEEIGLLRVVLACVGDVGMFIAFIVVYLYASEMFPTVVRNVGIGLSSMFARVGSMAAPYVANLGSIAPWLPPVVFGLAPLVGAALCLMMPETKGLQLMNTIEEGENFGKKKPKVERVEMTEREKPTPTSTNGQT